MHRLESVQCHCLSRHPLVLVILQTYGCKFYGMNFRLLRYGHLPAAFFWHYRDADVSPFVLVFRAVSIFREEGELLWGTPISAATWHVSPLNTASTLIHTIYAGGILNSDAPFPLGSGEKIFSIFSRQPESVEIPISPWGTLKREHGQKTVWLVQARTLSGFWRGTESRPSVHQHRWCLSH